MVARTRGGAPVKRLAAVRGGGGRHGNERHVHHFQIALLELEKARRASERQVALDRIRSIEDRLLEIDTLIRTHQDAATDPAAAGTAATERKTAATPKRRTLRY
jgi:hypothetical protein